MNRIIPAIIMISIMVVIVAIIFSATDKAEREESDKEWCESNNGRWINSVAPNCAFAK